jgi:hypothetical protein
VLDRIEVVPTHVTVVVFDPMDARLNCSAQMLGSTRRVHGWV